MRYRCTGCDSTYGEGINKPHNGFCEACWQKYLDKCRASGEQLMSEWAKHEPVKTTVAIIKSSGYRLKLWPLKYWKVRFVLLSLASRVNGVICKLLRVSVRRHILPQIRISITVSRD